MSDLSPRFRPVLDTVPAYTPGKAPVAATGQAHKLSSNESPYGPLPSVLEVIAEAASGVNRYPDNGAEALTGALAERFAVPADHVAVGCGSVGVLKQLIEAVGDPGNEVIYAWRSFEAYPPLADLAGATSVSDPPQRGDPRPSGDGQGDHPADQAHPGLQPQQPHGHGGPRAGARPTSSTKSPRTAWLSLTRPTVSTFADPGVRDGIDLYRSRQNVAVLRTFSKAYGLAGLRVGFLIGHPPVAEAVRKTMLPFTVSSVAQAAAVASLNAENELLERVETVVKERDRVSAALRADGWTVPETEANFVWLRLGDHTTAFAQACEATGVAVRPFAGEGARISIGTSAANDAFLALASAFPHRT